MKDKNKELLKNLRKAIRRLKPKINCEGKTVVDFTIKFNGSEWILELQTSSNELKDDASRPF